MDLKNVDSELLRKELNRRHEEEQRKKKEFNDNRRTLQQSALTSEVIDVLMPNHTRTSCSDDKQVNGWGSYSGGGPDVLGVPSCRDSPTDTTSN